MLDINGTDPRLQTWLTQPKSAIATSVGRSPTAAQGGETPPPNGTLLPNGSASGVEKPQLERATQELAEFAKQSNRDLMFSVDETSGKTVVTVMDGETSEVIRQIPSEEVLRIAQALEDGMAQLFQGSA
jgi:flagellar protein FlaG